MGFDNKVALITGAASGIGKETAVLFSTRNAKVMMADLDGTKGEEVFKEIENKGGDCFFVQADVSQGADVKRMIDATTDRYRRLDILINNAGIPMRKAEFEEIEEKSWDEVLAVNLKSMFLCSKKAVPLMKKQGGGVIINIASMSGVRPRAGHVPYTVSKGAAIVLTKAMALELAPYKIRVNCVSPVATDTPMIRTMTAGMEIEEAKKLLIAGIPLGRLAEAKDIAHAILFLASDESSMITGINLEVDGGRGI